MTTFPLRNRWTSNLSGRSRTASPDHHGPAQLHIAIHQYQSQKRAKNFAQYKIPRKLAVPRGVEPPTFGLGISRSPTRYIPSASAAAALYSGERVTRVLRSCRCLGGA